MFEWKESHLKTEIVNKEGYRVSLHVEIEPEDLDGIMEETYRDLSRNLKIPGFRKGKVPRKVIDSHLGAGQVRNEAIKNNLPQLYYMGIEESGIKPVSDPELNIIDLDKDGKVIFEAQVYVKPEVEVNDYKGIEVESPECEVTNEDVNEAIDELRERLATLEVVEGKAVEEGDYVLFDYKVLAEGISTEDASGSDHMMQVGSEEFIEGFDEQLVGGRKGDIIDISVKVPPDFSEESIAGKIATFKTLVKEIKHKVLPSADDNLAKETTKFETLDEFKEDLRPKIESSKKSMAERELKGQLVKKVIESVDIELPEPMVKMHIDAEMEEFAKELSMRGASIDLFLDAMGGGKDAFEDSVRERVVEGIMSELVLEAIADKENIEVSDGEAEEYIRENADMLGGDSEKLLEMARERDGLSAIKSNLRLTKAVDFLVESAVYTGAEKSTEEVPEEGPKEDNAGSVENINNASAGEEEPGQDEPSKEGED